MLAIQLISDTHLDHHRDLGDSFLATLPVAADVLAVAGDFAPIRFLDQARKWFKALCHNRRRVYYVPGNHEYYDSVPDEVDNLLAAVEKDLPVLRILRPGRVDTLDGHRVLGCTLWFRNDPMNPIFATNFPDFEHIKRLPLWVYRQNQESVRFLEREVRQGDVVLTHHVPSMKSIDANYRESNHNRFFLCDLEALIHNVQPALWMHGHVHKGVDYRIGDCRVVSNPFGYPIEPHVIQAFNERLVLEV